MINMGINVYYTQTEQIIKATSDGFKNFKSNISKCIQFPWKFPSILIFDKKTFFLFLRLIWNCF